MQMLLSRTLYPLTANASPDGSTPQAAAGTKQVLNSDRACDGRHGSHHLSSPRPAAEGSSCAGIAWPGLAWSQTARAQGCRCQDKLADASQGWCGGDRLTGARDTYMYSTIFPCW